MSFYEFVKNIHVARLRAKAFRAATALKAYYDDLDAREDAEQLMDDPMKIRLERDYTQVLAELERVDGTSPRGFTRDLTFTADELVLLMSGLGVMLVHGDPDDPDELIAPLIKRINESKVSLDTMLQLNDLLRF